MDKEKDIQKLLHKFILNQNTAKETQRLITYFKDTKLFNDFPTVDEVMKLLKEPPEMEESSADRIYNRILSRAKEKEKSTVRIEYKRKSFWKYASAAAIFITALSVGYFYQQGFFGEGTEDKLIPKGELITLQLGDGHMEIIDEDGTTSVVDKKGTVVGKQNGRQLVYDKEAIVEKLTYNTLTVPYGKRFDLQLSDGTTVYLNSGTSLKYPIKFLKGKNREVFLHGEAFFEVAKDSAHPFIVNAGELNVRVLGTHFNVSAYPEDPHINTVLVEGSVGLYKKGKAFTMENVSLLKPGFKGEWDKGEKDISIEAVDTNIYTGWINGKIIFNHIAFNDIIKKLERSYNVSIINNNKKLGEEKFTASFDTESITEVLQSFSKNYPMSFTIENNQIIIN